MKENINNSILIVDDDPKNISVMLRSLESKGFTVLVATDGVSAVEQAEIAHPDLILLDIMMPGINGFETCRKLKESQKTEDIPVIFMTARIEPEDKIQGFEAGAVDYVTKPLNHDEVLARVNAHITIRNLQKDLIEKNRHLIESEEQINSILESALDSIIITDGNNNVIKLNKAAEKMFQDSADSLIGRPVKDFFSSDYHGLLNQCVKKLENVRASENFNWLPEGMKGCRADGTLFPIEGTLSQMSFRDDKFCIMILRDIDDKIRSQAEIQKLRTKNDYLQQQLDEEYYFDTMVGESDSFNKVLDATRKVAATDTSVLIIGETGTGKELIARFIHKQSMRKEQALIKVNATAIPAGLVESEFFGHEKGAFTGALQRKLGRFEVADGGTIFLDEVGDIPLDVQVKLLRVLQEREFERVGGTESKKVNVRVVTATNRNLAKAVDEGTFRDDLYYRLNVFPIRVPPLRERKTDIPLLVQYFLCKHKSQLGVEHKKVDDKTMERLVQYSWPGNIRELSNVIERAMIISSGPTLQIEFEKAPTQKIPWKLEDVERNHVLKILQETNWVINGPKGAAQILDLHPNTLRNRMKKLGISTPKAV
jgi:formate hydrogenlyase transcriptional activator